MTKKVQVNKTDKFGSALTVGDSVIFCKGGQRETGLHIGIVSEMGPEGRRLIILDPKTNKGNCRFSHECILLKPYKDAHPEYFI